MPQIEHIKELYENEGLSLREIAKRTHTNFRTVQKYAYRNNWNPPVGPNMEPEEYPVLGEYIPTINGWLEQDEREPRKQQHTITRVFNRLQKEHGYKGSYATVKRYVNRKKDEMHGDDLKPFAGGELIPQFWDINVNCTKGLSSISCAVLLSLGYLIIRV